jgi:ABC-2 type transport system ATP-binding protein
MAAEPSRSRETRPIEQLRGDNRGHAGLINDPELVIVDEPTAGLDPEDRVRFRNVPSKIGFGKPICC